MASEDNVTRDDDFAAMLSVGAQKYQADNPTQFTRDRSKSVGASEVFRCPKYVWLSKEEIRKQQKENTPTPLNERGGFMMRGKVMEDYYIVPVMKHIFGDNVKGLGDDQETLVAKETEYLTATPDGFLVDPETGETVLVEFKTFDPRSYPTEPKPEHVLQTHVQMGITGTRKTYLIYVNASDYFDFVVFQIEFDEQIYKRAIERAKQIMTAKSPDELDSTINQLRGECYTCKFYYNKQCPAVGD